jgi:hypothetical protein
MRTRDLLLMYLTLVVIFVLGVFFMTLGAKLVIYALWAVWILSGLFVVAVLVVAVWLFKNIYRHIAGFLNMLHERREQKYAFQERQERWKLEQSERQVAIHIGLSRVAQGTYLIRPEMDLLPSEQDIVYLPAPVDPRAYGRGLGPGRARKNEPEMETEDLLPTHVRYEDVRFEIPRGHYLVGIGTQGLETRDKAVGACVWIVGLSGTGKTSTTTIRVEERRAAGHKFLGIDPHWFKPDSLLNALQAYEGDFLMPMAKSTEEALAVLRAFLEEFQGRKGGRIPKPWQPVTLLIDEVGSLMDPTAPKGTPERAAEDEIKAILPTIARICGQEGRNFQMGGIFISQQATGLSWLRKVATMVIVHQLLMESEKKLACNGDPAAIASMRSWPIGRTYIYGVGFQDGPRTVQQPFFERKIDEGDKIYPDGELDDQDADQDEQAGFEDGEEMEALQPAPRPYSQGYTGVVDQGNLPMDEDLREALEAHNRGICGPRALQREFNITYYKAQQLCQALKDQGLIEVID